MCSKILTCIIALLFFNGCTSEEEILLKKSLETSFKTNKKNKAEIQSLKNQKKEFSVRCEGLFQKNKKLSAQIEDLDRKYKAEIQNLNKNIDDLIEKHKLEIIALTKKNNENMLMQKKERERLVVKHMSEMKALKKTSSEASLRFKLGGDVLKSETELLKKENENLKKKHERYFIEQDIKNALLLTDAGQKKKKYYEIRQRLSELYEKEKDIGDMKQWYEATLQKTRPLIQ